MHVRNLTGASLVFLSLTFSLLHFLANKFYLYFAWWWFDILMHFLGGVLVGGFVLWLIRFEVPISIRHSIPLFATAFAAIMLVGISWEVFEYFFGIHTAQNYTLDTTLDLATGVVGMMSAYLLAKRI